MTTLAGTLRRLREKRGMTQEELAAEVGVGQAMISLLENGARLPSLPLTIKLAQALDVTINDLVITADAAEPIHEPA